jgi:hypothetical protein
MCKGVEKDPAVVGTMALESTSRILLSVFLFFIPLYVFHCLFNLIFYYITGPLADDWKKYRPAGILELLRYVLFI